MPHILIARVASLLRQWLYAFDTSGRRRIHDRSPDPWRHRPALRPAYVRVRREYDRA